MSLRSIVAGACLVLSAGPTLSAQPAPGAPQSGAGAFATGQYRNLFREAGHSDEEIRKKIDAAFQQLFHGDPDTQAVFYWAGENAQRPPGLPQRHQQPRRAERGHVVRDDDRGPARQEGGVRRAVELVADVHVPRLAGAPGVRLLLVVDEDRRHAQQRVAGAGRRGVLRHGAVLRVGALGRRQGHLRLPRDGGPPPVGHQEPRRHHRARGPARPDRIETDGAQFNLEHKMVRFTPDNRRPDHTDPSYHLPAFYELWARWGPAADRPFWAEAARVSRDFLQKATHPLTGLAPEYANFDGTPVTNSRNQRSGTFGPDAWRTAANWSVDWSWWAADPRERALSDRIQAFFESKGIETYGNRWTLDGTTELETNHSPALVATNAVARLAATHPRAAQVRRGAVERGDSVRAVPLLRRAVVPDGAPALQRAVPDLDAGVGRRVRGRRSVRPARRYRPGQDSRLRRVQRGHRGVHAACLGHEHVGGQGRVPLRLEGDHAATSSCRRGPSSWARASTRTASWA